MENEKPAPAPDPDKNPEPMIDLAVVYPYWDGLLHPRWVTPEQMREMFPEAKPTD